VKRYFPALLLGLGLSTAVITPAVAYPVDCAILLCLAGGWPASAECAHARAVFIRRITPWPIEPPQQIWNCPMRASFKDTVEKDSAARLFDVADSLETLLAQPASASSLSDRRLGLGPETTPEPALLRQPENASFFSAIMLRLAQAVASGGADIDISGPDFDYVRSIKVWHVEYRHFENRHGDCVESDRTLLGAYGVQGDYRWRRSSAQAAPPWMRINLACTRKGGMFRAVGVEWRDYQGNAGHEMVRY
jgi:hypothetical protein